MSDYGGYSMLIFTEICGAGMRTTANAKLAQMRKSKLVVCLA